MHADAQIGGPLLVQIARDKQQPAVPLAAKTTAVLHFSGKCSTKSQTGEVERGFQLHRRQLSGGAETQQAPEAWLQVMLRTNKSNGRLITYNEAEFI